MRHTLLSSLALVALCAALAPPPQAFAQDPGPGTQAEAGDLPTFKQVLATANKAYNEGNYPQAIQTYIQAIQLDPSADAPYRNIARAYFWHTDYSASLAYYDLYLTTFPKAGDVDQIQKERKLTGERATKPWQLPEPQRVALRQLENLLEQGTIYQEGGQGAWGAYQALLRTGYAQPSLTELRARLVRALLDEFDKQLVTQEGQPAPRMSLSAWKLEKERLEAAAKVALGPENQAVVARRMGVVEAALAMHLGRYTEVPALVDKAYSQNPELLWLLWVEAAAQFRANQAPAALETLQTLEGLLKSRDPKQLPYLQAMRAMLAQQQGQGEKATTLYFNYLMRP